MQDDEPTLLVDSGGAEEVLKTLLKKVADLKGAEQARQLWEESGEDAAAFLAPTDREDADRVKDILAF